MSNITESAIPDNILANIRGCANDALKILGGDLAGADPATVVDAVMEEKICPAGSVFYLASSGISAQP